MRAATREGPMNIAITLPADAPVGAEPVDIPLATVVPTDDADPYDAAAECMKVMMSVEAMGVLARGKMDSRDHIELIREDLLMPTLCTLYEYLKFER
jgi:hypothetical protein